MGCSFVSGPVIIPLPNHSSAKFSFTQHKNFRGAKFIKQLERLYEEQNADLGQPAMRSSSKLDTLRLRAVLDSVVEQLPPLLQLEDAASDPQMRHFDFPYHKPSLLSVNTVEAVTTGESVGLELRQVHTTTEVMVVFFFFGGGGGSRMFGCA